MDTQTITQSLAYISWVLLMAIGLGSLALVVLLRQATDATSGFTGFTALSAGLCGALVWIIDGNLPVPANLHIQAASTDWDTLRRGGLGLFTILAFVAGIRMLRGHKALWAGVLAVVAGVLAEAVAALGWAGGPVDGVPLLVQFLALSAVTGGSVCAVILAHWYLVTPRISSVPLVLTTRLLAWALGVQLLLFGAWVATGIPSGAPFSALTGSNAALVWLRLLVGIVFPLVLAVMAYRTALTRSMESATGLLYIELTLVLASTIVAAGLALGTGLLI
ncbi:MAG: hypothetical protein U0869_00195 [Chloroflexota bacterium]